MKGDTMGKEARIGLLLGATACLLAVMVDWVVGELHQCGPAAQQSSPAPAGGWADNPDAER
jgi:hypothetical protein